MACPGLSFVHFLTIVINIYRKKGKKEQEKRGKGMRKVEISVTLPKLHLSLSCRTSNATPSSAFLTASSKKVLFLITPV